MSFKCPHCGSEDKFLIMATMDVLVDADEEELDSDLEQIVYWNKYNWVQCCSCNKGGDVIDFRHASGKHLIGE